MMAQLDGTILALCLGIVVVFGTVLHAHRSATIPFNLLDLLMEGGKVSKIAVAFMLVLGVSTWVIVHLTIHDKMTEGYLTIYTGAWIVPLVTKVVTNKNDSGGKDAGPITG